MSELRPRAEIEQGIIRLLRSFKAADEEKRLSMRRALAEAMVDLRMHFLTPEGRPDWTGRTGSYRLAVRDIYSRAGYSKEEAQPVQRATSYHIGNLVRDRLSTDEVEAEGLIGNSPREQAAALRQANSALMRELLEERAARARES